MPKVQVQMDKQALLKFRPVLESTLWDRLLDDILMPHLEEFRNNLEVCQEGPTLHKLRGKIEFIKFLIKLKDDAKTALVERE